MKQGMQRTLDTNESELSSALHLPDPKMLHSKMYVPLMLCVLFVMVTTFTPETKNTTVAVEENDTTRQPTTAHANVLLSAVWTLERKLADIRTTALAEKARENDTRETTTVSSDTSPDNSSGGSAVVTAVAAGTSSSGLPASTAGLTTKPETSAGTTSRAAAQPSTAVSTATTETPPSSPMSIEVNTSRGERSTATATALTETQPSTVVTTATVELPPSFSTTTAASRAQSLNYTTADRLNHTDQLLQTSTSGFINETATASSTALATVAVSSLQPTAMTGNTSELLSTTSLNNQTFSQNLSHPTESSPTPKTSPELSSTSKSASTTSPLNSTTGPSETATLAATASPSSTTGNYTSAAGILIPLKPKKLPFPTTRSTPASTIPPSNQSQPCSTRSVANQCLIIIASLAAVTTIFMISTIVLFVKLSARNHKVRRPQQSTEMMCISALLPEKTYTYTRQRNPVSNGVLVFPVEGDSDEEGGDNLTLSSFLPDNDRYV